MKRTAQELATALEGLLSEENKLSDAAIALREDITDSVVSDTGDNWKLKYEESERVWRQRYADRFRGVDWQGDNVVVPDQQAQVVTQRPDDVQDYSYDNLFSERKEE